MLEIIVSKDMYLNFYDSGYYYCDRKVTRIPEITLNFAILPTLCETYGKEQEEEL